MQPIALSGSDYFHLLIDRKIKRFGLAGNISRVHFKLGQNTDFEAILKNLQSNRYLIEAGCMNYQLRWPLKAKWVQEGSRKPRIILTSGITETEFNNQILNRKVNNQLGLVCVDLCTLTDNSNHIVVSMHHALFDHQGMMNFIAALNNNFDGDLFPATITPSSKQIAANFWKMTFYMLGKGGSKLGSLLTSNRAKSQVPNYKVVSFTKEESKQIDQNAWKAGSRIGTSAFLISATAKCVELTLANRGKNAPFLWFSTPHKQQKIGAAKSLFTNQLSFLFFRLTSRELESTSASVTSLNKQLREQIKNRITERYVDLMEGMKRFPLIVYELMVDVSSRGKLASFGFSDLGKDQLQIRTFLDAEVVDILRYPPIPTPPGFNVAVVRTNEQYQFVFGYVNSAMSTEELSTYLANFKKELLQPS